MIKLCIFDLDGTLIDSLSTIAYFGNLALNEIGLAAIDTEEYKYFAGDGRAVLLHRMLKYHNADTPDVFEILCLAYDRGYENDPVGKTTVFDGMIDTLNELKSKNIYIAVCSNKPHNVAVEAVKSMFGDIFNAIYGLMDGNSKKPSPDTALAIADDLGIKPDECLFIGDTNVDIYTAKNANMHSCGVLWGFRDFDELNSAGAEFIVNKPTDIIAIIKEVV